MGCIAPPQKCACCLITAGGAPFAFVREVSLGRNLHAWTTCGRPLRRRWHVCTLREDDGCCCPEDCALDGKRICATR
jgi:hypothetical protein